MEAKPMITITEDDIDINRTIEKAKHPYVGAIVTFTGIVRDDGIEGIEGMEIKVQRELAAQELGKIRENELNLFEIKYLEAIHRTGTLSVGDVIVTIVCSAPHRKDAFTACEYVMDELQNVASIRKSELREE